MDSGKIKALATGARVQLMDGVRTSLERVLAPDSAESINEPGRVSELRGEAKDKEALVERVAYTWFNRLCALRLMDVRGYTPVPVVTPHLGETMPAILADARRGVFYADYPLKPADKQRVVDLVSGNTESVNPLGEAYVILLLSACDYFAKPIPALFGADLQSKNAIRLLAPTGLLAENSILQRIVESMNDENCREVEIMGWLYQYYIAELHDEVYAGFKQRIKAGPKELKPATQLFTPHWIVRYMVENSLGRLWMLNYPESNLLERMDYYIQPTEPETDYQRIDSPEDITFLDPACGSGHILVYAFDLLYDMYIEEGYRPSEIPTLILEKNLSGFEIDDRAAEIAIFALSIKAREKCDDFYEHQVQPNITVFDSIEFDGYELQNAGLIAGHGQLLEALNHLNEIGSLFNPDPSDTVLLHDAAVNLTEQDGLFAGHALSNISRAASYLERLNKRYSVIVANPPYLGNSNMNSWLSGWMKDNYKDEKNDLCTCFIERSKTLTNLGGYCAIVASHTWMFISSFKKMREKFQQTTNLCSLVHLAPHGFNNPAAQVAAFCFTVARPGSHGKSKADCIRLVEFDNQASQAPKTLEAINNHSCGWFYSFDTETIASIPDYQMAYWISEPMLKAFETGKSFGELGNPKAGITTGDNERFIRLWWEVSLSKISFDTASIENIDDSFTWFPCDKGGNYRKWYGNQENLMGFNSTMRQEMEQRPGYRPVNFDLQFKESITWGYIASGGNSFRYSSKGRLFDHSGISAFPTTRLTYVLGVMNSSVAQAFIDVFAANFRNDAGSLANVPILDGSLDMDLIDECISIAKQDYDSFDTSWDFTKHPLLAGYESISDAAQRVAEEWATRFSRLQSIERDINVAVATIYGLEDEVEVDVPDSRVSAHRYERIREVKSLISYAVGCMFGRYSLDMDGLILADQGSTVEDYLAKIPSPSFMPDEDGILPITEEEWFEDDIVTEFWRWLKAAFGEERFDENLAYIEETLGCKLREYFIKGKKSAFYDNHCKTYSVTGSGKRPIYWMFSSPKSSFNCLVYLHRYDDRTVSKILTDYVRELRRKLEIQARSLEVSDIARDRTRADKYHDMIDELNDWERDVLYPMAQRHIKIDLDDGVRHNYKLFPGALRKVTGLS